MGTAKFLKTGNSRKGRMKILDHAGRFTILTSVRILYKFLAHVTSKLHKGLTLIAKVARGVSVNSSIPFFSKRPAHKASLSN